MKRSVLDYLENTAKRCPERLAWDASAPFTFGQWWDAAQRIASSLSSRCARNTPVAVLMNPRRMCEGILRRVGGGVLLCAA